MVSQFHFLPSSWLFAKPSFKVTTAAYLRTELLLWAVVWYDSGWGF